MLACHEEEKGKEDLGGTGRPEKRGKRWDGRAAGSHDEGLQAWLETQSLTPGAIFMSPCLSALNSLVECRAQAEPDSEH